MPLNLKSVANGSVILNPASTVTDKTITLPATDGTMVVQDVTNTTTINNLAYTGTLTGGTGVINIGSGQVVKDAAGNLGLGVTPSAWGIGQKALEFGAQGAVYSSGGTFGLMQNAYFNGSNYIYKASAQASFYYQAAAGHYWLTAPSGTAGNAISFTQAMTLNASGNLLVGTISNIGGPARLTVKHGDAAGLWGISTGSSGSNGYALVFYADTVQSGYIYVNGSTTQYVTTSDYRLKENVAPMTGALEKVAQLKPCTYTWKADGSAGQGFIAHELQEVVPDCVTGEKDAVRTVDELDAEGRKIGTKEEPQYQGVDTSFLVATLVAAIQELSAQQTSLKAEFDAYKLTHP